LDRNRPRSSRRGWRLFYRSLKTLCMHRGKGKCYRNIDEPKRITGQAVFAAVSLPPAVARYPAGAARTE